MSLKTEELVLNMGPQHPSTHGVLRLELLVDGEIVKNVTPHLGYLHRCFEKHAEAMQYFQVVPYTDRLDYLASMGNNFGYVLTIEKLLNLKVPERVEYIRVIVAELQRIASHLVAIGTFGIDVGAFTPFLFCFRDREIILNLLEELTGARFLYNFMAVGGLNYDLPDGWIEKVKDFAKQFRKTIKELNDLLSFNKIFIERTANVGILPADLAINYGVSGPMLRASGVKYDVRKNAPYSIYDRFDFEIPIGQGLKGTVGDTWDRYFVRVLEMEQSLNIVEQAIDNIPEGNVKEAIPKKIKPPVATVYGRVENPRGELGFFVVSDGGVNPFRVKVRPPSFCNLSVINEICKNNLVSDVVAILGSIDIVLGEVDR